MLIILILSTNFTYEKIKGKFLVTTRIIVLSFHLKRICYSEKNMRTIKLGTLCLQTMKSYLSKDGRKNWANYPPNVSNSPTVPGPASRSLYHYPELLGKCHNLGTQ